MKKTVWGTPEETRETNHRVHKITDDDTVSTLFTDRCGFYGVVIDAHDDGCVVVSTVDHTVVKIVVYSVVTPGPCAE